MDKDKLYKLYVEDKLPMGEIGKEFGCDRTLIAYYARKFGFPKRNKSPQSRKVDDEIGDWVLLNHFTENSKGYWKCRCKCGIIQSIEVSCLNRGGSKSCRSCAMKKTRDDKIVPSNYWLKISLNAERRDIAITITREYAESLLVKQNYCCALTGWRIEFGRGRTKTGQWSDGETTASLDRIDSNLPYCEGNIQWVHKDINNMKQSFTEERLLVLCEAILSHAKEGKNVRSTKIPEIRENNRGLVI